MMHYYTHPGMIRPQCQQCNKTFLGKRGLDTHLCTDEVRFNDKCGRFSSEKSLRKRKLIKHVKGSEEEKNNLTKFITESESETGLRC